MAQALTFPFQRIQAFGDVFFAVFLLEPAADLRAAFGAADDVQPVQAGLAHFGRNDFDDVAVLQFIIQGDDLAVDLGADAAVADVGMDAVGEVDGNSPLWQVDDVAPRRKTKTSSEKHRA